MDHQNMNSGHNERAALIYGMQRSGSNYIQQVVLQNFQNVRFYNDPYARSLPTHKHFRLYEEKSAIPDFRFYNTFTYKGFRDFKGHVEQIVGREINIFIVNIKGPYSWYLSFMKHAGRNKYTLSRTSLNSHFIIDYNLFYRRWFDFSREAPGEVMMVKYEDFLGDFTTAIERMQERLNLSRSSESISNPGKVPMSKKFTAGRAAYYKEKKYLDLISDEDKSVIQHLLDRELLSSLNYKIVT